MKDERLDRLPLDIRQIREGILDGLEVGNVGEQLSGIRQIFVDIVEIGKDHVTPEYEFIKRFGLWIKFLVAGMQLEKLFDAVGLLKATDLVEEVIDRQHHRSDNRHGVPIPAGLRYSFT